MPTAPLAGRHPGLDLSDVLAASQVLYAYFDEAEPDGALIPPYQDWRDGREALMRLLETR